MRRALFHPSLLFIYTEPMKDGKKLWNVAASAEWIAAVGIVAQAIEKPSASEFVRDTMRREIKRQARRSERVRTALEDAGLEEMANG